MIVKTSTHQPFRRKRKTKHPTGYSSARSKNGDLIPNNPTLLNNQKHTKKIQSDVQKTQLQNPKMKQPKLIQS